jgi:mono/diheme cytochrome c family protein
MADGNGRQRAGWAPAALSGLALSCWFALSDLGAQTSTPPYSAEQAERGQASYEHSCQACHGSTLDNGDFGGAPLRGSWFRTHWGSTDVGALFSYLKAAMPPDNPGGLNDSTFVDILAFILRGNGYPPGVQELPPDIDALRRMPLSR